MASKWSKYDSEIRKIYTTVESNSDIARAVLSSSDSEYSKEDIDLLRTYVKRLKMRDNESYDGLNKITDSMDIDNSNLKHIWVKTDEGSGFFVNPNYNDGSFDFDRDIDFDSIIKKYTSQSVTDNIYDLSGVVEEENVLFDRLVYTDVHVGMDVNSDGFSLYEGVWDEDVLNQRLDIMIDWTVKHQKSRVLLIHDLGDFMDGYDAKTTRGGHSLPQNMDNQKAFDVGFAFKCRMIDELARHYDAIRIVNVCNDNHSGSFGYVVNSAVKSYVSVRHPNKVEITNQREFIDHYTIFNRTFILTHGKDGKNMKFGFKPKLDPVQIEKIKNYIDSNELPRTNVEFSKGDSHQWLFDLTSTTSFEYQNFGAFSPPSDWVKVNFKNTPSMFTFINYTETQKSIHNYIFKIQKK